MRRQLAVDFDGGQFGDSRCQPNRERARARPDFQEAIRGSRPNRLDNLVGPRRVEEMLAEAPARTSGSGTAYACSIDSPRQNLSSISSISSSLIPK